LKVIDINNINGGADLVRGYQFKVSFAVSGTNDIAQIGFSKISSIKDDVEVETIVEGNGYVHLIPKYRTQLKTITFSKGIAIDADSLLSVLKVGASFGNITVEIGYCVEASEDDFFGLGKIDNTRHYMLLDCVLVGYNISDLNASDSSISFENFEISYVNRVQIN
jgi:hypothetical protein